MKKSFLLIGALCVGAAFVSCVDDSESDEVKELRQIQLNKEKKSLDNEYWTMYNNAVAKVKSYRDDLKTNQQNLDDAKDGKITLEAAKAAAVAYQNKIIAQKQKDIQDKEAEIAVQKALKGMTYEQAVQEKIKATNAKEEAAKAAADYWIDLTNKGYNKSYDGYTTTGTVDATAEASDKIGMLLNDYTGSKKVKYRNSKLNENEWIKAMNNIFSADSYSYLDADGITQSSNDYSFDFFNTLGWKPSDYAASYTNAESVIKEQTINLYAQDGSIIKSYKKYSFKDTDSYKDALSLFISSLEASQKVWRRCWMLLTKTM